METSSQIYVNPLSDAGFKALLCDPANKPVLIGMLNAFLPPALHRHPWPQLHRGGAA